MGGMYKILPVHLTEQPFKNKAPRIKMLRLKTKITLPFLCCCFWIIIFSVFLSFFLHLAPYTHIQQNSGGECVDIPVQNQYQLIKQLNDSQIIPTMMKYDGKMLYEII